MPRKKLKNKRKSSFNRNFIGAWNYIKESESYIAVVLGFFTLFFILGFVFPYIAPEEVLQPILDEIKKIIEELIKKTEGKGFFGLWWFIFSHNSSIGFISIITGFLFSIIPIFFLVSNGLSIGLISSLVTAEAGFFSLWRLLPHGIFEIPAVILSFSLGIKFGAFIFNKHLWKEFKVRLLNSLRSFFLIIIPLFLIASFIETLLIFVFK